MTSRVGLLVGAIAALATLLILRSCWSGQESATPLGASSNVDAGPLKLVDLQTHVELSDPTIEGGSRIDAEPDGDGDVGASEAPTISSEQYFRDHFGDGADALRDKFVAIGFLDPYSLGDVKVEYLGTYEGAFEGLLDRILAEYELDSMEGSLRSLRGISSFGWQSGIELAAEEVSSHAMYNPEKKVLDASRRGQLESLLREKAAKLEVPVSRVHARILELVRDDLAGLKPWQEPAMGTMLVSPFVACTERLPTYIHSATGKEYPALDLVVPPPTIEDTGSHSCWFIGYTIWLGGDAAFRTLFDELRAVKEASQLDLVTFFASS